MTSSGRLNLTYRIHGSFSFGGSVRDLHLLLERLASEPLGRLEVNIMNRTVIALASILFLCVTTFSFAQQPDSGQQPDAADQQEPRKSPNTEPAQKPPEASPARGAPREQEKPPKGEKPEKSPKEQPKVGQEEHGQKGQ